MIVSPNAIIHLVRFFVRCTLYTCAPSLTRTDFFCKVWKRAVMNPIMKVRSRTVSPRVSKSRLRRVSSSCPSEGAWDKGAVRRNPIRTRCEDQPLNKAVDKEGRE